MRKTKIRPNLTQCVTAAAMIMSTHAGAQSVTGSMDINVSVTTTTPTPPITGRWIANSDVTVKAEEQTAGWLEVSGPGGVGLNACFADVGNAIREENKITLQTSDKQKTLKLTLKDAGGEPAGVATMNPGVGGVIMDKYCLKAAEAGTARLALTGRIGDGGTYTGTIALITAID